MCPASPPQAHLVAARISPGPRAAHPAHSLIDDARHSFTTLYQQHIEHIYRYHLARTGSEADAQDLTAETFHAALVNFTAYNPARGSAAAWLTGIARHKLADHFRRLHHTSTIPFPDDQPDLADSPEEAVEHRLRMAQVSAALRSLPVDRAEALSLHFFAGLSLDEVAQVMGKRDQAVKKLIHRGLADLRAQLVQTSAVLHTVEVIL